MSSQGLAYENRSPLAVYGDVLSQVEAVVRDLVDVGVDASAAIASARTRARALVDATGPVGDGAMLAALGFATDVVSSAALERAWKADDLRSFAAATAAVLDLPYDVVAMNVCVGAIRDPRLVALPSRQAIEAQFAMLFVVPEIQEACLWARSLDGEIRCVAHLGNDGPTPRVRAAAAQVLGDGYEHLRRVPDELHAVPVVVRGQPVGALVLRTHGGDAPLTLALARDAAAAVAPVLEKEALLERSSSRESSLVQSLERRLVRIALDLHDGALQDIAALAGDVRLFRSQLESVLSAQDTGDLLLGRLDDLEARLLAVDGELRGLAGSVEAPKVAAQPLADVLREQIEAFGVRDEITATLEIDGDFALLTPSQRIALIRIVQEALANVREHSGASEVHVSVSRRRGYLHAEVTDDGCGFDVERTLAQAAQNGRLGLVGMSERVRLLGGSFDVRSRPGGPTIISAALPEWRGIVGAEPLSELGYAVEPA